jgi:hypothetical protein
VSVEWRSSPNDGLRTLDVPEGTAAGGLSDMVPWAAARMLAYERPIRFSERLYIANECMHNWKQKPHDRSKESTDAHLCILRDSQS